MTDTTNDQVILVDKNDREIGIADKLEAHKEGTLHRALSVFVVHENEVLLQQRADGKYHSAGLWSNTCCSHPRPNEATSKAALRRLQEEMGICCELKHFGFFIYRTPLENGLIEHELDHVFVGHIANKTDFNINPCEAKNAKWMSSEALKLDLEKYPTHYTSWLKEAASVAHLF